MKFYFAILLLITTLRINGQEIKFKNSTYSVFHDCYLFSKVDTVHDALTYHYSYANFFYQKSLFTYLKFNNPQLKQLQLFNNRVSEIIQSYSKKLDSTIYTRHLCTYQDQLYFSNDPMKRPAYTEVFFDTCTLNSDFASLKLSSIENTGASFVVKENTYTFNIDLKNDLPIQFNDISSLNFRKKLISQIAEYYAKYSSYCKAINLSKKQTVQLFLNKSDSLLNTFSVHTDGIVFYIPDEYGAHEYFLDIKISFSKFDKYFERKIIDFAKKNKN